MYRTHNCGELRIENVGQEVVLSGWVQKVRNLGAMAFIDLRDRYGITQITVEEHSSDSVKAVVAEVGREYVLQVKGKVIERSSRRPEKTSTSINLQVYVFSRDLAYPFIKIRKEIPFPKLVSQSEL